jgi:antitoxin PrlF
MSSNLTSKGQVTIPKPMREHLGLRPGAPVEFAYTDEGEVVIRPAKPATRKGKPPSRFKALVGTGKRIGMSTDAYMDVLRGYDQDLRDPGFKKR